MGDKVKLNSGAEMPVVGLGTSGNKGSSCYRSVTLALDVGYRHFDTALFYGNEGEVGRALKDKINEGVIKRGDVFITSKLWNTYHAREQVRIGFDKTLKNLGMDYVDLFLMHWPFDFKVGANNFPLEKGKVQFGKSDFRDTWREMEKLVQQGLAKSIGLSNFNRNQILKILEIAKIKPAVNQIECHPYLNQSKLIDFCKSKGIVVTAYRPLNALLDPLIISIAEKHQKTPAQILIRFQVQRGLSVIPKSATKDRIKSNFDVFNFQLTKDEMNDILKLNESKKERVFALPECKDHPDYPFNDEF